MSVSKERLKALAEAGQRFQQAQQQATDLIQEAFLRARSQEQSWEDALRELYDLGQAHLLQPNAVRDGTLIALELVRLRLSWSKNENAKRASERKRREAGAQARQPTVKAYSPQAINRHYHEAGDLTQQQLDEINALRVKYQGPAAPAQNFDFQTGADPFTEGSNSNEQSC